MNKLDEICATKRAEVAEFLKAKNEREFDKAVEDLGEEITKSRNAGLEQERIASEVSGDDNAMRLEREFAHLTIPARVRLGYGTKHLNHVQGIDARRQDVCSASQLEHGAFAGEKFCQLERGFEAVREAIGVSPDDKVAAA